MADSYKPGEGAAIVRPGRKLDHSRDLDILDATLDLLAEVDYTQLTIEMIATRARAGKGTVYRRWSSKEELVIDAIGRMQLSDVGIDFLSDTGVLRDDLLSIYHPEPAEQAGRRLKIMHGLTSLLTRDQVFVDKTDAAVVGPWADAHLIFLKRARQRDEISGEANLETLAQVIPRLAAYRTLIERKDFTFEFLVSMVDDVLLPAVHRDRQLTAHPA